MSINDTVYLTDGVALNGRRQLLKAGAAFAALPILAASSLSAKATGEQATTAALMTDAKSEEFINGLADLMAHLTLSQYFSIFSPSYLDLFV